MLYLLQKLQGAKPSLAVDLDYERSSLDGYIAYTGPVLQVNGLPQKMVVMEMRSITITRK